MNAKSPQAQCRICSSVADISPVAAERNNNTLEPGGGMFYVCGLCREIFFQLLKCPGCLRSSVLDFTAEENRPHPNSCPQCGKVKIYSKLTLLPMVTVNRRYL